MDQDDRLSAEIEDLEQLAEGLHLAERDAVVAELGPSSYAEVDLAARLHASIGTELQLVVAGAGGLSGQLTRAGSDWLTLTPGSGDPWEVLVAIRAILRVSEVSQRAVVGDARSLQAKLGIASQLRRFAAERTPVAVSTTDGSVIRGQVRRVGRDFLELGLESGRSALVGFQGLAVVRVA